VAGLLGDMGTEIMEQSPESPAGRLMEREHFTNRIPATESRTDSRAQHICKACVWT